jgi:hypothetical protein
MDDGVILNNLHNKGTAGPFVYFGYLDPSTGKVVESSEPLPFGSTTIKDASAHDNYGVVVKWNTCLETGTGACAQDTDGKFTKAIVLFPRTVKSTTERTVHSTTQPATKLITVIKNMDGSIAVNGVKGFGSAVNLDVSADTTGVTSWTFTNNWSGVDGFSDRGNLYFNVGIFEVDSKGNFNLVTLTNDDSSTTIANPFSLGPNGTNTVKVSEFYFVQFSVSAGYAGSVSGSVPQSPAPNTYLWQMTCDGNGNTFPSCTGTKPPLACAGCSLQNISTGDLPFFQMLPAVAYDATITSVTSVDNLISGALMVCNILTTNPNQKSVDLNIMASTAQLLVNPVINCYADWSKIPTSAASMYNTYDSTAYTCLLNSASQGQGQLIPLPYPCFQWFVVDPAGTGVYEEWSTTYEPPANFWGSNTNTYIQNGTLPLLGDGNIDMNVPIKMRVVITLYYDDPVIPPTDPISYASKPVPNTAPVVCDFDVLGYNAFVYPDTGSKYQYVSDAQNRYWFQLRYNYTTVASKAKLTIRFSIVDPDTLKTLNNGDDFYQDPFDYRNLQYQYIYSYATNDQSDPVFFESQGTLPVWAPLTPGAQFNLSTLYDTSNFECLLDKESYGSSPGFAAGSPGMTSSIASDYLSYISPDGNTGTLMIMPYEWLTCTAHKHTIGRSFESSYENTQKGYPAKYDTYNLFPGYPIATLYSSMVNKQGGGLLGQRFKDIWPSILTTANTTAITGDNGYDDAQTMWNFGYGDTARETFSNSSRAVSLNDYVFSLELVPGTHNFSLNNARYGPMTLATNVYYSYGTKWPQGGDYDNYGAYGGPLPSQKNVFVSQKWCANIGAKSLTESFVSANNDFANISTSDVTCVLPESGPQFTVIWSLGSYGYSSFGSCAETLKAASIRTAPETMILFRIKGSQFIYVMGNGFTTTYKHNVLSSNLFFPQKCQQGKGFLYIPFDFNWPSNPTCAQAFTRFDTTDTNNPPPIFKSWLPYGGYCGYPLNGAGYLSGATAGSSVSFSLQSSMPATGHVIINDEGCGDPLTSSNPILNYAWDNTISPHTWDSQGSSIPYAFDDITASNLLTTSAFLATAFKLVLVPYANGMIQTKLGRSSSSWKTDTTARALTVLENSPHLCTFATSSVAYAPSSAALPSYSPGGGFSPGLYLGEADADATACNTAKPCCSYVPANPSAPGFVNPMPVLSACVVADTALGQYSFSDFYTDAATYRDTANPTAYYNFIDTVCFPGEPFRESDGYSCPEIMGQKLSSCSGAVSLNFRNACESIGGVSASTQDIKDDITDYYAKRAVEYCDRSERNAASPECACLRGYDTPVIYPGPPPASFTEFLNENPQVVSAAFPTCLWPGCWPRNAISVTSSSLSSIYAGSAIILGVNQNERCPLHLTNCFEGVNNADIATSNVVINLINECTTEYCQQVGSSPACPESGGQPSGPTSGPVSQLESKLVQIFPQVGPGTKAKSVGLPVWAWILIALGVVAIVLVIIFTVRRRFHSKK